MIGISMRGAELFQQWSDEDSKHAQGQLQVMRRQEEDVYRCENYILRRSRERSSCDASQHQKADAEIDEVDELCREQMCGWSYRVIDHFRGDREIVSLSFSYLDRFLDRCNCDRTAFKLAAITSLYVAMKMLNHKHVSMASLAELSRGEFDARHVAEMEQILLRTLSWRMNPPTTKAFVDRFLSLLGLLRGNLASTISQRAHFFAELSVFDYFFVTENPSVIAYASILNAVEGLCPSHISEEAMMAFRDDMERYAFIRYEQFSMGSMRARLWHLYRQSDECKSVEKNALMVTAVKNDELKQRQPDKCDDICSRQSPVYVADHLTSAQMC